MIKQRKSCLKGGNISVSKVDKDRAMTRTRRNMNEPKNDSNPAYGHLMDRQELGLSLAIEGDTGDTLSDTINYHETITRPHHRAHLTSTPLMPTLPPVSIGPDLQFPKLVKAAIGDLLEARLKFRRIRFNYITNLSEKELPEIPFSSNSFTDSSSSIHDSTTHNVSDPLRIPSRRPAVVPRNSSPMGASTSSSCSRHSPFSRPSPTSRSFFTKNGSI